MELPLEITVAKSSIAGIGWKSQYVQRLMTLVANVHTLVSHTFAFLKFIFLHELEDEPEFPSEDFVNEGFFTEVFLSLLKSYKPDKQKASTKSMAYKDLIHTYRDQYFQCCSYEPIDMKYAYQIASYETAKILTAYLNGIKLQSGNKTRMFLNLLLKKKERIKIMESNMKKNGQSKEDIVTAVKTIIESANKVKQVISSRNIEDIPKEFLSPVSLDMIRNLFGSYSSDYQFSKGSIYYDSKVSPLKHTKAYYRLSKMFEVLQDKTFNRFPLRRGFIPCYMTIDTHILNTHILNNSVISHLDKEVVWGSVLNITAKAMRSHGEAKDVSFRGMIYTDGIGVSVLKQNHETKKKGAGGSGGGKKSRSLAENDFQYVEKLEKEELRAGVGKCVFGDPGRRDLLCLVHENSTTESKSTYRYTRNQRSVEAKAKKFKKLRNDMKTDHILAAELSLSQHNSSTANKEKFI